MEEHFIKATTILALLFFRTTFPSDVPKREYSFPETVVKNRQKRPNLHQVCEVIMLWCTFTALLFQIPEGSYFLVCPFAFVNVECILKTLEPKWTTHSLYRRQICVFSVSWSLGFMYAIFPISPTGVALLLFWIYFSNPPELAQLQRLSRQLPFLGSFGNRRPDAWLQALHESNMRKPRNKFPVTYRKMATDSKSYSNIPIRWLHWTAKCSTEEREFSVRTPRNWGLIRHAVQKSLQGCKIDDIFAIIAEFLSPYTLLPRQFSIWVNKEGKQQCTYNPTTQTYTMCERRFNNFVSTVGAIIPLCSSCDSPRVLIFAAPRNVHYPEEKRPPLKSNFMEQTNIAEYLETLTRILRDEAVLAKLCSFPIC